ncbi:BEN domain-containing protein 6-like isoform X2 [Nerophis lumbriciformis]|uniref:BEN domain-containing protein 6-like isoform X2 n=1 Tax=Nerophis lumbriciformis TaxID=546530 RepID=UPI003BACCCAC
MADGRTRRKHTKRRYLVDGVNPTIPKQSRRQWRETEFTAFQLQHDNGADYITGPEEHDSESESSAPPSTTITATPQCELEVRHDTHQDTATNQKKKRKVSRTAVGYDAWAQLEAQLAALGRTSPKDTCTEMESLKKEVLQLREENKSLRDALRVVEGLPGLLMKMDDLSRQATILSARRPAVDLQIPTTSAIGQSVPSTLVQTTERLSQPPYPSTPTSHRSSPVPFRSPTVTPTQAHLRRVFDYEVDEDGQVDLGYGVAVNANNLQYVSGSGLKKTTYTVCEVVFTREEMANSSLTGKKSNAFKDKHEKPKLDDKKVSAIIDFVKKLHPSSEANVIKKIIGVKLNIAQKMEKKKASETNSAGPV